MENNSGVSIRENDDDGNGNNFRITEPVNSGNYYINVSSYGARTGSYEIYAEFEEDSIGSSSDDGIKFGDFAVTELRYDDDSDWDQTIQGIFGSSYRVADWNDLKTFYSSGGDLLDLYDGLGLSSGSAYVTRDGDPSYSSSRYYFASRHEHSKPSNYLAHDNIDNYLISLGSWYGSNIIMAVKKSFSGTVDDPGNEPEPSQENESPVINYASVTPNEVDAIQRNILISCNVSDSNGLEDIKEVSFVGEWPGITDGWELTNNGNGEFSTKIGVLVSDSYPYVMPITITVTDSQGSKDTKNLELIVYCPGWPGPCID